MKKFISSKAFYLILGIFLFLILWFILSLCVDQNGMIFPNPYVTIVTMFQLLKVGYTYQCLGYTFLKMLIGFGISFVGALIFGILAGNFRKVKYLFEPTVSVLKSVPTAAIVFLFLVLLGVKQAPIAMVILITFPILYEAIVRGIENMNKDIVDASRLDEASFFRKLWKIELPQIAPYVGVGIASSISLAFKIEIMAEIIAGDTGYGIGSAILTSQRNNPTDLRELFAYSLLAIIIVFIFSLLLKLCENKIKNNLEN